MNASKPKASTPDKLSVLKALVDQEHALLDALRSEDQRLDNKIQALEKKAAGSPTSAQKEELKAYYDGRDAISRLKQEYNMIIVIKLNTSGQVASLVDKVKKANADLKASLEAVNKVIKVVNTVGSLLKAADSLLKTVLLLASL